MIEDGKADTKQKKEMAVGHILKMLNIKSFISKLNSKNTAGLFLNLTRDLQRKIVTVQ